ncbi:hypothetical protein FZZ93_05560 [Halomonas eurihalina]|uniref:DUF1449 family protein n=1 Tax=Halomonas eurihalina TaxID=42566 RepID=A0A5D9D9G0_HALER|nr:hypothetical protein [Halomonas eurihalina]MDR5859451.1 hypothetical protein [Halomonas eurihalina]TZG40514.1 hypothetical protein FZZ93_05560 [Halomonas eurihalina]
MNAIINLALSFPLIVFTVLLALVAVYWLLVLVRLAPTELFEHDSLKKDHLASTMVSLGFAGVPVSVALSLLVVLAGALSLAVELLVLRWVPLGIFRVPVGVVVLWASFAVASPLTAGLCRRLHCRLHRHPGLSRRCLLGERVRVTGVDDDGRARAVMEDDEAREVQLLGKAGNQPASGDVRILVKYLPDINAYRSVLEQDYLDARTRLVRLHLVGHHEASEPQRHGHNGSTPSA